MNGKHSADVKTNKLSLTYAGFKELVPYSLVHADRLGHFFHVGSSGLAQSTDTVDAADSLCQECISCLHTDTQEYSFSSVIRTSTVIITYTLLIHQATQ